jgi:hypothetical protein
LCICFLYPAIENSYVRINVKRFNISRRAISETTFRGISPETITLNLTKSQERHLLIFQALMILRLIVHKVCFFNGNPI